MELLLVYNAKSNFGHKVFDGIHKIVSPSTYKCELCSLTHHQFGERKSWEQFRKNVSFPIRVLYKNEFLEEFGQNFEFPVVFINDKSALTCILDKKELAAINDLEEFFVELKKRLPKYF